MREGRSTALGKFQPTVQFLREVFSTKRKLSVIKPKPNQLQLSKVTNNRLPYTVENLNQNQVIACDYFRHLKLDWKLRSEDRASFAWPRLDQNWEDK